MSRAVLRLNGQPLSLDDVESVARGARAVELDPEARSRVAATRAIVDRRAGGSDAIYGVNTGFGSLSRVRIAPEQVRDMQRNLVRSHASGVGERLPRDVIRSMMLLSAASLARARSGVRPEVIETLLQLLNRDITPIVPSRGSVGASGDLAPLAHMALTLIGEGMATSLHVDNPSAFIMRARGVEPLRLEAKEGLALINGTHLMAGAAALLLVDLARAQEAALCAAALAIDACRATDAFLDHRLHEARGQPGQIEVARRLRELLAGSAIVKAHREGDPRVQDPYCLRATPQVLGGAFDAIAYAHGVVERELGAVTDNPLGFGASKDDFVSGGNFHGMPLAIALDALAIAMCHVAGISERRVNWLLSAFDAQNPVPPYLSPEPGAHSGLMITQYAAAACVNEMMTLAAPASVGNIPTSAGIEDYNSMGATSAHKALRAIRLLESVIAIELLVMTEAMEYQRPLKSGAGVERVVATVRRVVPKLEADRPPADDIAAIEKLIRGGAIRAG